MSNTVQDRIGVCSWSLRPDSPDELIAGMQQVGLSRVQLALIPLRDDPAQWSQAPQRLRDAGITIASGMFGTIGEDYSTLESIRRTGGLVPDEHWPNNWAIIQDVARLARQHGIDKVGFHAGFIPHDPQAPTFAKLIDRIRQAADCFAQQGIDLFLETGQETADDLLQFLRTLDRPNVGVNFDPANMILYDKGDPIESLRKLLPHVRQVHLKDAIRTQTPGTWGTEVPLGQGQVDWPAFVETLRQGGFTGGLMIEREAGPNRVQDIRQAVERISRLLTG
jgi:sugar phosphate isomerase/epimerase